MRLILVLICLVQTIRCANILGVMSVISPSHHLWNEVLAVGLAERGHNVTFLSHDQIRNPHENYTVIELEGIYKIINGSYTLENSPNDIAMFSMSKLWFGIQKICEMDLDTTGFKSLWNYPKDYKFDLILWDVNAGECLYPLIRRFGNPPVVATSPFGLQPFISDIMGHHVHNYLPYMIFPYTDRMNFWQRLLNTMYINYVSFLRNSHLKRAREFVQKKLGIEVDDFGKIERNFSLALVNTDAIYNFPETFPPNIIPVAGIHIVSPKPLSEVSEQLYHGLFDWRVS